MNATERRQAEQARLRERVNEVQHLGQALTTSLQELQAQTLQWVRQNQSANLPASARTQSLSAPIREMQKTLTQLQKATIGSPESAPSLSLTAAELTALLKD